MVPWSDAGIESIDTVCTRFYKLAMGRSVWNRDQGPDKLKKECGIRYVAYNMPDSLHFLGGHMIKVYKFRARSLMDLKTKLKPWAEFFLCASICIIQRLSVFFLRWQSWRMQNMDRRVHVNCWSRSFSRKGQKNSTWLDIALLHANAKHIICCIYGFLNSPEKLFEKKGTRLLRKWQSALLNRVNERFVGARHWFRLQPC